MLSWLDGFFSSAAATIGAPVANAVHWAVHALASVVFAVFKLVGSAWAKLVDAVRAFHAALDAAMAEVVKFATWIVKVELPALRKWAESELAKLAVALAQLYDRVTTAIADLIDRIAAAVASVTSWVISAVWDPIQAALKVLTANLIKWGFTAYTYITHPQMLADLLIMPLINSLVNNAAAIAEQVGAFLLTLMLKNVKAIITVIEDIITAVF
jgi:hypothetical protein